MGDIIEVNPSEYVHERVASPAALRRQGLTKFRSVVTPSGHVLRIAFPPGPRRRGSGRLQAILHPKENPRGTKIYERVISIRASKAGMPHQCDEECRRHGHRYEHKFRHKAAIYGMPDGSLRIVEED